MPDADHVLTDLKQRFDAVLAELESVAGWIPARIARPVQILGSLDGIETRIIGRDDMGTGTHSPEDPRK